MKKPIALLLALALALGLCACGAAPQSVQEPVSVTETPSEAPSLEPTLAPAPDPEPSPEPTPEPEPSPEPTLEPNGPTITAMTFTDNLVYTYATEQDWINSPSCSSNIASVTLSDGTYIEAENGGVLTLVVDGEQYDILDYYEQEKKLPETGYSFETTAGTVGWSEMGKFMNMAGQTAQYTYRSALKVTADGIDDTETIPALLGKAGEFNAQAIRDGALTSNGPFFNGIIVDSAPFTVENMTITGNGDGANDFQGQAAMVLSQGTADVTIQDSVIQTAGVIRTAAAVKDSGILRINNSVLYTRETEDTQEEYDALVVPMMKRTPFALGLEGVVRATNVLGAGQGIYTDAMIVSSGWGVLSTDSGNGYDQVGTYALDVKDTVAGTGTVEVVREDTNYFATKTLDGVTYGYIPGGSGYVAYADSGVFDRFDNVRFYGGNEVQIMASANSSAFYTNSDLTSGHIGVMTQQNAGGTISITDSTLTVGETGVQIKSGAANNGYTHVILDNTQVNFTNEKSPVSGTLIELVESDDAGNPGNTSFTIDDRGDEATTDTATAAVEDSTALLKNGDYTGDIWNNIYNKYQVLDVTVDNATLTGSVSSSYGYHLDEDGKRLKNGTVLEADTTGNYLTSGVTDYQVIGAQYNVPNTQINNPVNLTLTGGAVWHVAQRAHETGGEVVCHINDLTVEKGCAIETSEQVTLHVYGKLDIQGQVDDKITIVEEDYTPPDCSTNILTAVDMADPRHTATFVFVDESGNPAIGAASFSAYKAFATSYFSLAMNNYALISMDVTEGSAVITEIGPDDPDGYYGEYDYNIAMDTDCTVTVVVKAVAMGFGPGGPGGPGGPPPM